MKIFYTLFNPQNCYTFKMEFVLPTRWRQSKNKWFYLNLNNYRSAHHRTYENIKRQVEDYICSLDLKNKIIHPYDCPIQVHYNYYSHTSSFDRMNVLGAVDKFLMDALVKAGIINNDTHREVLTPTFEPVGKDRENPRVEVTITAIRNYKCKF